MAKREKKPIHKVVMTEGKRQIIQQLLQEWTLPAAEGSSPRRSSRSQTTCPSSGTARSARSEKGGDRVVDRSGHPPVRHPRNRTYRGPGSEGGKDGRWKKYAEQYKQQRPDDQVNASLFAHDEYLCCP